MLLFILFFTFIKHYVMKVVVIFKSYKQKIQYVSLSNNVFIDIMNRHANISQSYINIKSQILINTIVFWYIKLAHTQHYLNLKKKQFILLFIKTTEH